ncbi:Dual specificity protein kinase CLK4 [Channa argus]|uniref:dual-specificity kinase n=1 Tax=Channa argus TaxID=215402 RepID=A0A6G1QUI7_CHAAH|nr:Dual specificity protein kinase CLK4 [Channa argus]
MTQKLFVDEGLKEQTVTALEQSSTQTETLEASTSVHTAVPPRWVTRYDSPLPVHLSRSLSLWVSGNEYVAVKIVRNTESFSEVATSEITVLEEINRLDEENRFACVRMLDWFQYRDHVCIVFELLGLSTFEVLKQNEFLPFSVEQIRQMSFQIFKAVCFLHQNKLTHTDLKPENILFVCSDYNLEFNNDRGMLTLAQKCEPKKLRCLDVKVVDFGTAIFDHEHHESLTHESKEHLAMMEKVLGPIPSHLLKQTRKQHFVHNEHLNWDEQGCSDDYIEKHCKPLKQYMWTNSEDERQLFDLLSLMLEYDVSRRITMEEALWHPFFSPVIVAPASFVTKALVMLRVEILVGAM